MGTSRVYFDTIIHTSIPKNKQVYLFKIDKSYNDSLNIRRYIPASYFLADTIAYFILVNFSGKPFQVDCLNDRFLTEEISQFEDRSFRPIDILIHPWCATTRMRSSISLQAADILIIRDYNPPSASPDAKDSKTYLRMKTSAGILVSAPYFKRVNRTDFFIPLELEQDYNAVKRQIEFKL